MPTFQSPLYTAVNNALGINPLAPKAQHNPFDEYYTHNSKAGGSEGHLSSNTDKITGQRVVTYNIRIEKQIAIENVNSTTVGENVTRVADELQRLLLAVVNDSQIRSDE